MHFAPRTLPFLALLLVACAEQHDRTDPDAATAPDAATSDASTADVVVPPACPCAADQACVRGVCVASCGADLSTLDADLGEGRVPVAHLCFAPAEGPLAARLEPTGELTLMQASLEQVAPSSFLVDLRESRAALDTGRIEESRRCGRRYTTTSEATAQLGARLGLTPEGRLPHFALSARGETSSAFVDGMVFVVDDECTVHGYPHVGAHDATLLSESLDEPLAYALPFEGNGLWRGETQLYPTGTLGSVVRWGDAHVLAPTISGHGAVVMSLFDIAELRAGTGARPRSSEITEWPLDFVAIEGLGIVGRPITGADGDHLLYEIRTDDPNALPYIEPTRFASARFTQVAPVTGTSWAVLAHEGGLLVVR